MSAPSRCRVWSSIALVDELRLMVYPVLLGSGKRLFGEMRDKKRVRLTDTQLVGEGIVIHTYENAQNGGT